MSRDVGSGAGWRTALALGLIGALAVAMMARAVGQPSAFFDGTDVHVHRSWEAVNRLALAEGHLPHWNPYSFAGYPGQADIQTHVFYPPSVLLRWLPLPAFFTWGLVFHLWVLGAGMFALCRQLGTTRVAALAAAAGVMLSGGVAPKLYAGHIAVLYGYAWFPLAASLAIRSANRSSVWPHPALVGVLVLQLLAGFLQGTVYVFGLIGAFLVYRAWRAPSTGGVRWRQLAQPLLLFALVGGLAAFQLVPTARLASHADRSGGRDYAFASENALAPADAVTAVFPSARGLRPDRWDSNLFVTLGLLAFVPLAWLDVTRRRRAALALLLALAALALALADILPFYRLHHLLLPPFRAPTRLLFFWTIGIAALGGLGVDALLRRLRDPGAALGWLCWTPALTGALLLGLAVLLSALLSAQSDAPGLLGSPVWLVAAQLAALLALGVLGGRRRAGAAGVVLLLLVATEGLVFATPLVRVTPTPRPPTLDQLAGHDTDRVVSLCERHLSPSDLIAAGIPTTDGFGGISLRRYTQFLSLVKTGSIGGHQTRLGQDTDDLPARLDLLDLLSASHVITCGPVSNDRFRFLERLGTTYFYENLTARPRAVLTCPARVQSFATVERLLGRSTYDAAGRLPPALPTVHVRWVDGTASDDRQAVEGRFGLAAGQASDGRTWRYDLRDASTDNIKALVGHPLVEDTAGLERTTGQVVRDDPEETEPGDGSLLVDGTPCGGIRGTATVTDADRGDGLVRVIVDTADPALLFLSEPRYPERRVWVDGSERRLERVNLAFSGVHVEPGRHVVELRFVPRSFQWGAVLSSVTLVGWVGATWSGTRRRRRRLSSAS